MRWRPSFPPISLGASTRRRHSLPHIAALAPNPSRRRSMVALPKPQPDPEEEAREEAAYLETRFGALRADEIVALAAERFAGQGGLAAVSSFGADSAALLHIVSQVDRSLPVIF